MKTPPPKKKKGTDNFIFYTAKYKQAKNGRTLPPIDYNSIASVGSDLNQTKPAYSQESLPPRSPEYCKD